MFKMMLDQQDEIVALLVRIADDVGKLAGNIPKPPSVPKRILETTAVIAGALSLLTIIDLLIKWLGGG